MSATTQGSRACKVGHESAKLVLLSWHAKSDTSGHSNATLSLILYPVHRWCLSRGIGFPLRVRGFPFVRTLL
jgi:hypothetical protein